jgi:hypothetical protein
MHHWRLSLLFAAFCSVLLLALAAPVHADRSITISSNSSAEHFWNPFQQTKFLGEGTLATEAGDTVLDLWLMFGTNVISDTSYSIQGGTNWYADHTRLHYGAVVALGARVEIVDSSGMHHTKTTPATVNVTCEP